ncbi:thermonuclease family protein [Pseudorhodobacter turbinis]|uniref:Thermonuclease family protein n=2 Tax=Pseudorhodobacter turbinis TaxID=2500533 RepID=A0A4P8EEL4_9RHOB|nr:thermonuclease family protein [Pseudorhodobacter turbinis]
MLDQSVLKKFSSVFSAAVMCASLAASETSVVDGDTIDVDGIRMRINAIDAPEYGQKCGKWACGKAATEELARLIGSTNVTCNVLGDDGMGREIATCFVGEVDLGREMVRNGLAWAFVKYSEEYTPDEAEARRQKLGIWATTAIPPWEYRAARWAVAEQEAPDGCPIKGNISKNGMIYHAPWSPWYKKTSINEAKGERWFCSEAEAVANGWRAPRWR